MTFRTKLLVVTSLTVAGAVALVTGAVSVWTRRAFERIDGERRSALLDQFHRELDARGQEIVRQVERAAASAAVQQIVGGAAEYDRAQVEAEAESLDFLDVVQPDLTIISSAHWPARFGYKNDWQIVPEDWSATDAFLTRIPTPDGNASALIAVRPAPGGKGLVVGGKRLNPEFLKSLGLAPGMRALLGLPPGEVIDAQGAVVDVRKLSPLIDGQATQAVVGAEAFQSMRLTRHGRPMGVLLAGTSLRERTGPRAGHFVDRRGSGRIRDRHRCAAGMVDHGANHAPGGAVGRGCARGSAGGLVDTRRGCIEGRNRRAGAGI